MEATRKRYRNFMVKNVSEALMNKARTVAKYTKDGEFFYHVGLFSSCSVEHVRRLSGDAEAVSVAGLQDYTHVQDILYGLEKVQKEVTRYKQEHEKKLQRGKLLYTVLQDEEGHFHVPATDKECIRLYMNYLRTTEEDVQLYPWQKALLQGIGATDRSVIWVYGVKGGEGKTWFQKYIERSYGERRVYLGVVSSHAENIAHAMKRELLAFKDIFLFNIVRSDGVTVGAYSVLEGIKDH